MPGPAAWRSSPTCSGAPSSRHRRSGFPSIGQSFAGLRVSLRAKMTLLTGTAEPVAMRRERAGVLGRPLRVYVDTSVFGGVHDDEFRPPSERFLRAVRSGAFTILVSETLVVEISNAPETVQATFEAHRGHMEALETTVEAHRPRRSLPDRKGRSRRLSRGRAPCRARLGGGGRCPREPELQAPRPAAPHPRLPRRERAARLTPDRDPLAPDVIDDEA